MKFNHRTGNAMTRRLMRLPDPEDYHRGCARPSEPLPDNILLFARTSAEDLGQRHVATYLHQRWVLLVPFLGSGTVWRDGRPSRLGPDRAALVPPLRLHAFTGVPPSIAWLLVTFEWPGVAPGADEWMRVARMTSGDRDRLEALGTAWDRPDRDGLAVSVAVWRLVRGLFPAGTVALQKAAPPDGRDLVGRVHACATNLRTTHLARIASAMAMSESHLRARFRQETGLSLGRYLRERRLREAALAMREDGLTVKETADRFGFSDIHTFSRAFRRVIGRAPSHVRTARPAAGNG